MQALYFDGLSSRPYQVEVSETHDGLQILFNDEVRQFARFWKMSDIRHENFNAGEKVILCYGDFPQQKLEMTGPEAHRLVQASLTDKSSLERIYYQVTQTQAATLVISSLAVIGLVIYLYLFHVSPFVGEKAVALIPIDMEVRAGDIIYKNMSPMIDEDSTRSEMLEEFFVACGFESDYPIRIDYAQNSMVNAFAIPGGQIVIYEGLLEKTERWDELAALMGHELAHVNERHSFKQLARSVSAYLILSVLTGDVAGASTLILENANYINQMSNSRAAEKEADVLGLEYLKENRIRPEAMVDLFSRLLEAEKLPEQLDEYKSRAEKGLEFLSSHPLTSRRISYIEKIIEEDPEFRYRPATNPSAEAIWKQLMDQLD